MEQQNFSPPSSVQQPIPKGIKPFWLIILLVLVVALVGVLLWQKNNANQISESLQQQIISLHNQIGSQGQSGQTCFSKVKEMFGNDIDWSGCSLKEGGIVSAFTDQFPCCSGLTKTGAESAYYSSNGNECIEMPTPRDLVCTNCGNGVCGLGENKCNCPADCKNDIIIGGNLTSTTKIKELEQTMQGGHQPWRSDVSMVLKADGLQYGFSAQELDNAKQTFESASTGVAFYEVSHKNATYQIMLLRDMGGFSFWYIIEIKQK